MLEPLSEHNYPKLWGALLEQARILEFDMAAHAEVGALLKGLVAAKPHGNFLELGTGIGASLCWMVDGLDADSTLITLDNDPRLCETVQGYFAADQRIQVLCADGDQWLQSYRGPAFDLIFADAWPGKYSMLRETLDLLKVGGLYVIDDMNPQENWPTGHQQKAQALMNLLGDQQDLTVAPLNWSTGVVISTKIG